MEFRTSIGLLESRSSGTTIFGKAADAAAKDVELAGWSPSTPQLEHNPMFMQQMNQLSRLSSVDQQKYIDMVPKLVHRNSSLREDLTPRGPASVDAAFVQGLKMPLSEEDAERVRETIRQLNVEYHTIKQSRRRSVDAPCSAAAPTRKFPKIRRISAPEPWTPTASPAARV